MSIHRLYRLYELASDVEKQSGRAWYNDARTAALGLAVGHNTTLKIVSGVIAALSPNTHWDTNLEDADRVLGVGLSAYELAD